MEGGRPESGPRGSTWGGQTWTKSYARPAASPAPAESDHFLRGDLMGFCFLATALPIWRTISAKVSLSTLTPASRAASSKRRDCSAWDGGSPKTQYGNEHRCEGWVRYGNQHIPVA